MNPINEKIDSEIKDSEIIDRENHWLAGNLLTFTVLFFWLLGPLFLSIDNIYSHKIEVEKHLTDVHFPFFYYGGWGLTVGFWLLSTIGLIVSYITMRYQDFIEKKNKKYE